MWMHEHSPDTHPCEAGEKIKYRAWGSTRERVLNKNHRRYKDYGGSGITICDRWRYGENGLSGFECFLADMGPKPHPKLTIERRGNHGNYEPSNCYWGTREEQANNRRTNVILAFDKDTLTETLTLAQWNHKLWWRRGILGRRLQSIFDLRSRVNPAPSDGRP
jgi:hypothetical protein